MGKIRYAMALVWLCIATQNVQAQFYEITYKTTYKPRVNDSLSVTDHYVLKINAEKRESLFTALTSENALNLSIYKNFSSARFIKYESILDQLYKSTYLFDGQKWQLSEGGKPVNGYSCRKAFVYFGGRQWEAWYTAEIPFQEGPYKFTGLPGLILEIYSLDGDYHFTAAAIEKKLHSSIAELKAIPFANPEKEKEYKLEVINDPAAQYRRQLAQLKSNGLGVTVSFNGKEITQKETENRIITEFKLWMDQHDNPIEKGDLWLK